MAGEAKPAEVERVLAMLKSTPSLMRNIALWRELPARPARYAPFPEALSPELLAVLKAAGIEQLYTHQAQAIEHILAGRHVVIVTPTASGKTLCFNLPVIQTLLEHPESRALYLFPTKALAQDQMKECHALTGALGRDIKVYTYDGDTPATARRAIRTAGHIVVTNPDMLHAGILPHHTNWIKLFENLRYIVIDEIHHYRGVFGSHLANVLRRLRRITEFYGARPVFICCSATIANPLELARELIGEDVQLVDDNGAPRGKKTIIFYNPPVVNQELGIRRSVLTETRRLATRFLKQGVQTIVFARSRLRVEILVTYLKRAMKKIGGDPERIKGYRGGYLPRERRAIEEGVKSGAVLGVVSTNALELGIDIGQLKAALLAGYPGTITSTWQQGGRAGRSSEASVVVLIASSAPLDQFIVNHPEYFLGASPESAIINPENLAILASHLKCATFELPFTDGELFGETDPRPLLEHLDREQIVRHTGGRWHWSSEVFPAEGVSLRSATVENFVVIDVTSPDQRTLAEVDYDSAPFLIHEDAIYLHQSETYFIERLDWDGRTAYARRVAVDYYTDAQAKTDIKVLAVDHFEELADGLDSAAAGGQPLVAKNFGEVSVQTLVAKYKKIKFETHENVGWGDIHLPQNEIQTEAYWLTFHEDLKPTLERQGLELASGLRALATVLAHAAPLFAMCDPRDLRATPMVRAPHDALPTIYIHDRYPGGIGLARKIFAIDGDIAQAARGIVEECRCAGGCPSCVGPALELGDAGKRTAAYLLERLATQLARPNSP